MAPLPQTRGYIPAAALDNSVFVFGENNQLLFKLIFYDSPGGVNSKDDVLRYDPINDAWTDAGKMTTPRYHLNVAPIDKVSDVCN